MSVPLQSLRNPIMSFVEELRKSREGRTTALHEFWTNFDPKQPRFHAFFEGHADIVFYKPLIQRHTEAHGRLFTYRCEGKSLVYDAFKAITGRHPNCRGVLFFVDKDIDDIIGEPWPTDPRIYVTDVYSIENYLVCREALRRVIDDLINVRKVAFDMTVSLDHFDRE